MPSRLILPDDQAELEPAYNLPHGKVWQRRAEEIIEPVEVGSAWYVLRRLSAARNMLVAGAVLRHASGLEHPRCWGPNFWITRGQELWTATIRPHGEPLITTSLERLSWSEALDLWRPLAEAIGRAHQRGIVHGQITPWTVWYDSEAERLTAIDAGCWVGDLLPEEKEQQMWWAPELRVPPLERVPSPFVDIYGLARLLVWLTRPREEATRQQPNLTGLPAFAIPAIDRALKAQPSQRVARVEELLAATSPSLVEEYDERVKGATQAEITSVLAARVSNRQSIEHPRMGEGIKFFLNRTSTQVREGEEEQVGAFFYDGVDRSLYESVQWGWDGAQVNLIDARLITDSQGRQFITSHRETLPVLEPTFPISVSNVLKAERCTSRFLVDERDGGSSSRALVLGNIVHGLLEDLTAPDPPSFEAAFEQRARSARLAMLGAGLVDRDLEGLERDARQHYANLERFTRAREDGVEAPRAMLAPSPRWQGESVYNSEPHHNVGWSGRHIEVTRYSPLYGLEGRIDLATEDEREGVQIIELKSGRPWDGHLSQVRCYTLLWDGLAKQRGLEVSGYVLYSRHGRLNAVPMDDISRERRILRARNELVACHRANVDPTFDYRPPAFMDEPQNCRAASCKFRKDRCQEQTEMLGLKEGALPEDAAAIGGIWRGVDPEIVARAWIWWRHFDRLIEMERWAQNSSLGAVFQQDRLGVRIAERRAVTGMQIISIDLGELTITFGGEGSQIFSPGNRLLAHRGDLHSGHVLQGYVQSATQESVTIRTQAAQIAATLEHDDWILDNLPARIGVRHAKRAAYGFLRRRDPRQLGALLDPLSNKHLFEPDPKRRLDSSLPEEDEDAPVKLRPSRVPDLNERQKDALDVALHSPLGALIQGPPGTGKTTVIAHIVRSLVLRGERVLVCAQTNTAVDTILSKVWDAGVRSFLRVGPPDRSPGLSTTLTMSGADDALYFTKTLAERTNSLEELGRAIATCPVLGSTTHAAVGDSTFEFLDRHVGAPIFDVVIVDEASQLTEPMTLAAINLSKRFILVGDHRQLPPIVQSEQAISAYYEGTQGEPGLLDVSAQAEENSPPEADTEDKANTTDTADTEDTEDASVGETPRFKAKGTGAFELDETLESIGCAGLDRSLFERLAGQLPHVMLEEQYRMHSDIMAFSNRAFYQGRLFANEKVAAHGLSVNQEVRAQLQDKLTHEILSEGRAVHFINVNGFDAGRSNLLEARAVIDTLEDLLTSELFLTGGAYGPRPSIGIISPFRAQVQLIRTLADEQLGDRVWDVDIDTVERYQGGERDIILVSMVKTERAGDFLTDLQRLNVTLTRARKKLVIFGNRACLALNPTLRALLEQEETHAGTWEPKPGDS
jgi:DNA replication ATP-dependent helicase Dna2